MTCATSQELIGSLNSAADAQDSIKFDISLTSDVSQTEISPYSVAALLESEHHNSRAVLRVVES